MKGMMLALRKAAGASAARQSRPASSRRTRRPASSESRAASGAPAEPAPTTMTSYIRTGLLPLRSEPNARGSQPDAPRATGGRRPAATRPLTLPAIPVLPCRSGPRGIDRLPMKLTRLPLACLVGLALWTGCPQPALAQAAAPAARPAAAAPAGKAAAQGTTPTAAQAAPSLTPAEAQQL